MYPKYYLHILHIYTKLKATKQANAIKYVKLKKVSDKIFKMKKKINRITTGLINLVSKKKQTLTEWMTKSHEFKAIYKNFCEFAFFFKSYTHSHTLVCKSHYTQRHFYLLKTHKKACSTYFESNGRSSLFPLTLIYVKHRNIYLQIFFIAFLWVSISVFNGKSHQCMFPSKLH